MRILIVEDEEADLQDVLESLEVVGYAGEVDTARSRDSALEKLNAREYDFIICDIRIPTSDGGLDLSEEHGFFVHSEARAMAPGVPQLFLTGQATPRNIKEQIGRGGVGEAFGTPDWIMVQLAEKDSPSECEQVLRAALNGYEELSNSITIETTGAITERFETSVRTFARRHDAVACQVTPRPGLSGAEVARVVITDRDGNNQGGAFVKLLPTDEANDEMRRYENYVQTRLAPGLFAPAMKAVSTGLGRHGALLFTIADPTCMDLFELTKVEVSSAATGLRRLFTGLGPWMAHAQTASFQLGDLRRKVVDDAVLLGKGGQHLLALDSLNLEMDLCVSHGDLHGQNLLVSDAGAPMLIDFADAGLHPRPADPVVLELSFIFHRERPNADGAWPTAEHCRAWADIDAFSEGSPVRPVLEVCREEAQRRAPNLDIAVVAYCHSLRQLKYGDVDPRLALALAEAAAEQILVLSQA